MIKVYKELTEDQKKRGVVFSSSLSSSKSEERGGIVHEVFSGDSDGRRTIEHLKDDKFFNGSPWKYNIIRS